MNNLSKRNSLIAIIISLVIMLASALGIALFPGFGSVKAAEYNYGEFNENGYYELNGVVFYGVKIKWTGDDKSYQLHKTFTLGSTNYTYNMEDQTITYSLNDVTQTLQVSNNQFVLSGTTYTIASSGVTQEGGATTGFTSTYFTIGETETKYTKYTIGSSTVTWPGDSNSNSANISNYEFTIDGVTYAICDYSVKQVSGVVRSFIIDGTIYRLVGNQIISETNQSYEILDNTVTINGVTWTINENTLTTGAEGEERTINISSYWPSYEIVKDEDGNIEFVRFGETVLLKEDEAVLICFARQTDDGQGTGLIIDAEGNRVSTGVDFLDANVVVDGVNEANATGNQIGAGSGNAQYIKELGYVIDPNGTVPYTTVDGTRVYHAGGLGVNSGREGLVEFATSEYEVGGILESYSFMFYAFKYDTYKRTETLNPDAPESIKERPNTQISATNYVTDPSTQEQYFSESFYYYSNQNLPYLEFDPLRYEITISKTIHRNTVDYSFYIDPSATSGQTTTSDNRKVTTIVENIGGNSIVQQISQTLSTMDIYARGLRLEAQSNGNIRIYFEDLGQYTVSYTAVYYKDGTKINLDNLNTDTRSDLLTIFGTEATYQDYQNGQTPFRNESNTIYADMTGIVSIDGSGANNFDTTSGKLSLNSNIVIASTNQPEIRLLFNTTVSKSSLYSQTIDGTYTLQNNYSYTSSIQNPGYYVLIVESKYSGYKTWLSTSNTARQETLTSTQIYVFQIKEQTPNLTLFVLGDDGEIVEENPTRVYDGTYVKNGVQIVEFEQANEFDSRIYFELTKTGYGQSASQSEIITLPNEAYDELTSEQIAYLASYGIVKYDGYYILKPTEGVSVDGEYNLSLRFGNSGRETVSFKLDTQPITGITAYTAESVYGSDYYRTSVISSQGQIALTNSAFTVLWNNKASGAEISASFIRFALEERTFEETNYGNYILNSTWLAADYSILISSSNPVTSFQRASSASTVETNSVLTFSGLYIFRLEDEAGNVAYYSVILDTSTPTVLQRGMTSGGDYQKIGGVNNVTEATTIFFGSHKAISFRFNNNLTTLENLMGNLTGTSDAVSYLTEFFGSLSSLDSQGIISVDEATQNLYAAIPIVAIYENTGTGTNATTTRLPDSVIAQGYYNRTAPLDENGRLMDIEYRYQIFDASNRSSRTPTRTYTLRFNTDQTGLLIYTEEGNSGSGLNIVASETTEDYTMRTNYYNATTANTIYLSWESLFVDDLGVFVDLENNGLTCNFYPLVYDAEKHSYVYSETPIPVSLGLSNFSDEQKEQGYDEDGNFYVQITINFSNNMTIAGKYVVTREYSSISGEPIGDLGNDFQTLVSVFFVDRGTIITPDSADGERNGYYTYITTFDGVDTSNREFFNELYRQSQTSGNYILQTNQLPIGFYIPTAKYGTVYGVRDGMLQTTPLSLEDIQNADANSYRFTNLISFNNIDINEYSTSSTFSPFDFNVVLISPATNAEGENVYYYYSYVAENGFFLLSGYSYGELGLGEEPTPITNRTSFITNNPVAGNSQYAEGNYILQIGCIQNFETNGYYQTFNVIVNVVGNEPEYDMVAQYPDLDNMEDKEIQGETSSTGAITYYTNTNSIRFSWTSSSNSYLAPIDVSGINFAYYVGSSPVGIPNYGAGEMLLLHDLDSNRYYIVNQQFGDLLEITQGSDGIWRTEDGSQVSSPDSDVYTVKIDLSNGTYSFVVNFSENASRVEIQMAFETYSTDTGRAYTIYYPNGTYSATRRIVIDRSAPTSSITSLKNSDRTVETILESVLRESNDSRYSKSATTGTFRYYTFAANADYFVNLSRTLQTNAATETKTFYFRSFNNKYSAAYQETGLGLDSSSRGDNLFSEYFAVSSGWTRVSSELEEGGSYSGFYEVVEIDLAGNMTIYSIYIGEQRNLTIDLTRFTGSVENGNVQIYRANDQLNASVYFNGQTEIINNIISNPIVVESYDYLTLNNISFSGNNTYNYLKIIIDNTTYYITPFNFENVGSTEMPRVVATSAYDSMGQLVSLDEIQILGQSSYHIIQFFDTVNKTDGQASLYNIQASVAALSDRLTDNGGSVVQSDVAIIGEGSQIISNSNLTLVVTRPLNPSLDIDESSIRFFKISSNGETYTSYSLADATISSFIRTTATNQIKYYYINSELDFYQSTFFIVYKDNFGNEYRHLVEYREAEYNRFEGEYDITDEMQNQDEILASGMVAVNISNLYSVAITDENGRSVANNLRIVESGLLGASYTQYQLLPITTSSDGYYGGRIIFKLVLSYNIPEGIYNELAGLFDFIEDDTGAIETIYVTIYNQLPEFRVTDSNGQLITDSLFNKEITQSEPITISFNSGNSLSEEMGFTSRVFLRLRNSSEGYIEITSPYTVSEPGIYDIYVQNFDEEGNALDYVISRDFEISDLDVMFYTVVKTDENGNEVIVSPTGNAYEYRSGSFASYHYIVNTSNYRVVTNGSAVDIAELETVGNTTVYEVSSNSGTIYRAVIAVTVVPQTTNLFTTNNSFVWYLGTNYSAPSEQNYINSTNKDIYLCQDDIYDEITLRWGSYYSIPENKIICYVSSDDGQTWSVVSGNDNGTVATLTLRKSVSYLFRFEDLAGNVQYFSSSSGFPSSTTRVNFIRSVIFNVNGGSPVDNAIYNGTVTISIPVNTNRFYSTTPTILVYRNGSTEPYSVSPDSAGNYVFTESGIYVVSFSARVENGTRDLNEDVLLFSIINPNDSRWAFNYVNYNNYTIESITYNGTELSQALLERALSVANEINISAFDVDSIGNKWFNNGTYTITLSYVDDALGKQTFEFSFWLNDATPPINVSLEEGQSTTGSVTVEFNRGNLYDVLGDCYIQIDGTPVYIIDETTVGTTDNPHVISGVGNHYIQVYTSSGKLVYSYQVRIDRPMDTMTIIIIVVACVVVVAGVLIFVLLRKKMQVR